MKKLLILSFVIALFACEEKVEKKNSTQIVSEEFELFKKDFIAAMWEHNPVSASYAGYHKYDSLLPIPNKGRKVADLEFSKLWLKKLSKFDPEGDMSDSDKIDFYLIKDNLTATNFYQEEFKSNNWNPSNYNLGGAFFQVINYKKNSLNLRLELISKKLDHVQAYYEAAKTNLTQPTEVHTDLAIKQLEGSKSIFNQTILDSLDASTKDKLFKEQLKIKVDSAVASIDNYINFLKREFVAKSSDTNTFRSFRIGEEMFSKKFDYQIQSDFTAKEIFHAAILEKQDLHANMFKLSNLLWEKYYGEQEKPGAIFDQIQMVIDAVAQTHVQRDSFVSSIRQQIPALEKFVEEHDLLTLDPKKPLIVRETPEYMRGFAGASISAPGPYDSDAATYYNVTPLDNYSEAEAESYLREYNDFTLQILNIHEAISGHYTQLVYANKSPSLIKSLLGNGAMIEGWAVYTERMMLEEGYGGDQLEMGLMYYKWNLRTVCNTILDYGVHVMNYTKEDAMQLLMTEAFQEKSEAEGKWKRAKLSQVQLCSYYTGFYEILKLREECQAILGDNFDLKTFHEDFLSYGSSPVKYIRKLMLKNLEQNMELSSKKNA